MKYCHYISILLIPFIACYMMFGCGEPTDTVLDVMQPTVVVDDPPPTTTPTNPNSVVIEINTPPEIIDRDPDTELPVFDTAREAIRDDDIDQHIDDMDVWIKENCGKVVHTDPILPVQILFTDREERDRYIDFIQEELEYVRINPDDMHEVDGDIYFFLRFEVNREEATKPENCE